LEWSNKQKEKILDRITGFQGFFKSKSPTYLLILERPLKGPEEWHEILNASSVLGSCFLDGINGIVGIFETF